MFIMTREINFARHIASRTVFIDDDNFIEEAIAESFFAATKSEHLKLFLSKMQY